MGPGTYAARFRPFAPVCARLRPFAPVSFGAPRRWGSACLRPFAPVCAGLRPFAPGQVFPHYYHPRPTVYYQLFRGKEFFVNIWVPMLLVTAGFSHGQNCSHCCLLNL